MVGNGTQVRCRRRGLVVLVAGMLWAGALPLRAQEGARITNAGVVRATAKVDSVFIARTVPAVTVDAGDFLASLLARIGAGTFNDSAGFRVTSDSALVRLTGRLMDFSAEKRKELGPLLWFIDSTAVFVAEIAMPQSDSGLMRFRLERILVNGLAIPEAFLAPAIGMYSAGYKELTGGGREFLVAMPPRGKATLLKNQIRLSMHPAPAELPDRRTGGGGPP